MGRSSSRTRSRGSKRTRQTLSNLRLTGYLLLYGVLAVGLVAGVREGYRFLNTHPMFAIKTVALQGVSSKTEAELRLKLKYVLGRNFFRVDLDEVHNRVSAHPWVASTVVSGQIPDKIRVVVRERRPAGLARLGNSLFLLSTEGSVICALDSYIGNADMPILIGLEDLADQTTAILAGLEALGLIKENSLFFWNNIETLDLSDNDNMVVQLRNERAPIHLGDKIIAANLKNYLAIAQHVQNTYPALDYIELGFPNQIAIKPSEGESNGE